MVFRVQTAAANTLSSFHVRQYYTLIIYTASDCIGLARAAGPQTPPATTASRTFAAVSAYCRVRIFYLPLNDTLLRRRAQSVSRMDFAFFRNTYCEGLAPRWRRGSSTTQYWAMTRGQNGYRRLKAKQQKWWASSIVFCFRSRRSSSFKRSPPLSSRCNGGRRCVYYR